MAYQALISTNDLLSHLEDASWVIIDCRFSLKDKEQGFRDYSASHIPGARYAHLDNDLSGEILPGTTGRHPFPEIDDFVAKLQDWGIDNNAQVIAYDDMGGAIAARLWIMLKWLGHKNVAVLDGGWQAWVSATGPVSSETLETPQSSFTPDLDTVLVANVSDVEAAIEDSHICLIDARASERYAGKHEPLDPVAGHIPSALSFPWQENLDEHKHFLPVDQLKTRFEGIPTGNSISYCGSGVTAAHNMLAMAHAGLPLPRLYAGSWSHWITTPNHIIATDEA